MSSPVHDAHYADQACHAQVRVLANERLARDTFRVRLECPELARRVVPGQFVMLRLAGMNDPLLGRPLALYDTVLSSNGEPTAIDVVYLVVGKMTGKLATIEPNQMLEIWGPLGNGFAPPSTSGEHLLMVAGGIGQTPFMAVAREAIGLRRYGEPLRETITPVRKVTLCYGARSAEYLAGVEDFRQLGVDVRTSTDDGSAGHHGLVTDLARQVLAESPSARIVCCGPERMMEAVAELAEQAHAPCHVSLETPMACGVGICFSCVTKLRDDAGGWDYRRTCVEGPIFDAKQIVW
jgi:dihydroorotate dehydrogenase electron transfer subunit